MGIVNVTPDSFSDGGDFFDPTDAIDHALQLVADGADILDIGGESTRPTSEPVDEEEEIRRIQPVVSALCNETNVPVSIDTSKSTVARVAMEAGAEIINDVTGLEGDPRMARLAVESAAGVCVMHMQGTPQTMQDNPTYDNVVRDILEYLKQRRDSLAKQGVELDRICLDPGIGFGKTHEHNLTLVRDCRRFHELGCPILAGPSRKGFIGKILGDKVLGDKTADRTTGTIGVSLALARQGVQILRVHDVREVREALLLFEAGGGLEGWVE